MFEPEPDLCFGTHLTGTGTPQGGATPSLVACNPVTIPLAEI
jgi:hypothetical protein